MGHSRAKAFACRSVLAQPLGISEKVATLLATVPEQLS